MNLRFLLPLVLLLPLVAAAGTADAPEIVDATGDASPAPANAYADILDAWFEPVEGGVDVHLRIAAIDAQPLTTAYFVLFEANGTTRFATMAFRDDVDGAWFARGTWNEEQGFAGETDGTSGTLERGSPSHAVIRLPAKDFGPDGIATKVHALVVDYKPDLVGEAPIVLDATDEGVDFRLETAETVAPEPAAALATVPGPGAVAGTLGAVAAVLLRGRAGGPSR